MRDQACSRFSSLLGVSAGIPFANLETAGIHRLDFGGIHRHGMSLRARTSSRMRPLAARR